ncbi:MAG: NDP-sugar synthase [Actinomycetes bacterium]
MSAEAVLLVGGQGTRLRPLTLTTPKQMLPLAGHPLLTHQITKLREAGISHVVMATSYRAETFSRYYGDGTSLGVTITYVVEDEPLGTGGAIGNVSDRLESGPDEPIVILNGDNLSGHDLGAQLVMHRRTDADVTLHLVEVEDARAFGCVPCDDEGRVQAFLEKMPDPVTSWVNAGCYVFRRSIIDTIPGGQPVSVERETFPGLLAAGGRVYAWRETAYWSDVGTPAAYVQSSADMVRGRVEGRVMTTEGHDSVVADSATIAVDCTVDGGSSVGADVVAEAGSLIRGSVVMAGAHIGAGAVLENSAVGVGARVGAGVVLADVVVGDGADIGAGNELLCGARVWPGTALAPTSIRFSSDV